MTRQAHRHPSIEEPEFKAGGGGTDTGRGAAVRAVDPVAASRADEIKHLRNALADECGRNDAREAAHAGWNDAICRVVCGLAAALSDLRVRCDAAESELKDARLRLNVYENPSNPDRTTIAAKKRRQYRKEVSDMLAEGEPVTAQDVAEGGAGGGQSRMRGGQPGSPGSSLGQKPDRKLDRAFAADMCAGCGRTDVVQMTPRYKLIEEARECSGLSCHMEIETAAFCGPCSMITHAATDSIPGTACGPRLRGLIANIHAKAPAVESIQWILKVNHGIELSTGAISKCVKAMAAHARNGSLLERVPEKDCRGEGGEGEGEEEEEEEEEVNKAADAEGEIAELPAPLPGARTGRGAAPYVTRVFEEISMAPHAEIDESTGKRRGRDVSALVLLAPKAALIHVKPGKSKKTMQSVFSDLLRIPMTADMYLAGNSLTGPVQTCIVHVWRKSEALAAKYGTGSPEHTYSRMFLEAYRTAVKDAAAITEAAGGPDRSACDTGRALRTVPGLAGRAQDAAARFTAAMERIISAYRTGKVTNRDDCLAVATAIENALPYMTTFFFNPGMPNNTNRCERLIRGRWVAPRNAQHSLPDWMAALTQGTMQTIHANAFINGIAPGDIVSGRRGSWQQRPGRPPPHPCLPQRHDGEHSAA